MIAEVGWTDLLTSLLFSGVGLSLIIYVRVGKRDSTSDPSGHKYYLRLYAKMGGWILCIVGIMATVRILGLLLAGR
jgi:hypothetical protein